MFNLGPLELVAIFVVALLVFGPDKLPEMGRQVGKAIREFRKFQESMQGQVRDVLEPISGPIVPNGNIVGPSPTNIRGVIPTEVPEGQKNVPRSATIQDSDAPEGEDTPPPGTFGHYAPVQAPQNGPSSTEPQQAGPAPAGGESAAPAPGGATQAGETPPPSDPAGPESR
jgi:sec-independent protein translocase protein TatB